MITEDYVSFETAKLLKEKGFDEPCNMGYNEKEQLVPLANWRNTVLDKFEGVSTKVTTPTLQKAMKWLREIHGIYIMIDKDFATEKGWHYVVARKQDWADNIDNGLTQQESNSYTYEFACEAAIKYCLENLI